MQFPMHKSDISRCSRLLATVLICQLMAFNHLTSQNCESCNITITPNPFVDVMCDPVLKVTMLLDESGSIVGNGPGASNIANAVRDGAMTFLSQLDGSPIQVRIIEFNSQARQAINYTLVTTSSISPGGTFHKYLYGDNGSIASSGHYDPEDYTGSHIFTNWEAAMHRAHDGGAGDLLVFFTDGNPTARCLNSSCSDFETRTPVCDALSEGEAAAEIIKAAGTRVLGIGYPNQVLVECNISAVSGSNKYNQGESILTQADFIEVTSNEQLISAFNMIGESLIVPCVVTSEGAAEETTICATTSVSLEVNAGQTNANWKYKWNDPSGSTSKSIQVTPSATTTYRVTVTDLPSGCSQICSFKVLTEYCCEAPVLSCPVPAESLSCEASPTSQAVKETPNGLSECAGYSISYSESDHPGACGGTYVRTWRLRFENQTIEECSQTVTVAPAPMPSAITPANTTMECADNVPSPTELFFTNGLTGDCEISGMVMGVISGAHNSCGGSYVETWSFSPNLTCGGQPIVQQRLISVSPGAATSLNCDVGHDLDLECGSDDQETIIAAWLAESEAAILATANSPCGVNVSITNNFNPNFINTLRCNNSTGAVVRFTVTDECGQTITCTKNIFLIDTTEPVWERILEDDSVACDIPLSDVPWPAIGAIDACTGPLIVTHSATEGEASCAGSSIIRTYTAVDNCGNRAEMSYTIHLIDEVAPVIIPPADVTISCSSPIPDPEPVVTDACSASTVTSLTETRRNVSFCEYDLIRTWTATDECGNTSTASQIVSYRDLLPPEITLTPEFESLLNSDGTMTVYGCEIPEMLNANAIVTDDCCFIPARLQSFDKVVAQNICDVFGYHTHYRCGYEYTDVAGHTARFEFDVYQYDTVAPIIHNAPSDMEISCNQSIIPSPSDQIFATDNCDAELDVLFSENTLIEQVGSARRASLQRTWTFVDNCGNSTAATQTIQLCDIPGATKGLESENEHSQLGERTHMSDENNRPTVGNILLKKSKIVAQATAEVEVSPNPTRDLISLSFSSVLESKVTIRVTDQIGHLLQQHEVNVIPGFNKADLNLSELPTGIYLVQLVLDKERVVKKIMKF